MSTLVSPVPAPASIPSDPGLHAFLCDLESDSSLLQPANLRERLIALDQIDAAFGSFDLEGSAPDLQLHRRARVLRTRLEAINAGLYQSLRSEIVSGSKPHSLLEFLQDSGNDNPKPGAGFDYLDELVSGVLQLCEPAGSILEASPEMVPYQPTPVRHVLHLIAATRLVPEDVLVDLGSGLGHVPILASLLTAAHTIGIEVHPAYVNSARECVQRLQLGRVQFIPQDAREADLASGTVFYLYSPFKGSILTQVLSALRMQAARRPIRICSLGPITIALAKEKWLQPCTPVHTGHITVFTPI